MPELENEEIIEQNGEPEPKSEKLYAGKFKSPEEMEHAYSEAERSMTQAKQEAAEERQRREQWEQYYSTQQTQQPNPANPDDPWEEAIVDPAKMAQTVNQTVIQALTQYDQYRNAVDGNIESALAKYESDPRYKEIGRAYRAELKKRAHEFADPRAAGQRADESFKMVLVDYVMNVQQKVKENPAERSRFIKDLGIEEPESETRPSGYDEIDAKGRAMLDALGISDKDKQSVIKEYEKMRGLE